MNSLSKIIFLFIVLPLVLIVVGACLIIACTVENVNIKMLIAIACATCIVAWIAFVIQFFVKHKMIKHFTLKVKEVEDYAEIDGGADGEFIDLLCNAGTVRETNKNVITIKQKHNDKNVESKIEYKQKIQDIEKMTQEIKYNKKAYIKQQQLEKLKKKMDSEKIKIESKKKSKLPKFEDKLKEESKLPKFEDKLKDEINLPKFKDELKEEINLPKFEDELAEGENIANNPKNLAQHLKTEQQDKTYINMDNEQSGVEAIEFEAQSSAVEQEYDMGEQNKELNVETTDDIKSKELHNAQKEPGASQTETYNQTMQKNDSLTNEVEKKKTAKQTKAKEKFVKLRKQQLDESQQAIKRKIDDENYNISMYEKIKTADSTDITKHEYDDYFDKVIKLKQHNLLTIDDINKTIPKKSDFISTKIELQENALAPQILMRGEILLALIYVRNNLVKIMGRADNEFLKSIKGLYPNLEIKGNGWYNLIVDCTISDPKEVYAIIDKGAEYIDNNYYEFDENGNFVVKDLNALSQTKMLIENAKKNVNIIDPQYKKIIDFNVMLSKYQWIDPNQIYEYKFKLPDDVHFAKDKYSGYYKFSINGTDCCYIIEREGIMKMLFIGDKTFVNMRYMKHFSIKQIEMVGYMTPWYSVVVDYTFLTKLDVTTFISESLRFARLINKSQGK